MDCLLDLPRLMFQIDHAMALVRQDRWLLGSLQQSRLRVLADSSPEPERPYRRTRPLTHLARRCLHERRPLTVTALGTGEPRRRTAATPDWELDWPAVLYAPVGMPGHRPLGLLVLGARRAHWYAQAEIDYAAAVGAALTGVVLPLAGPLGRLSQRELEAARLIAAGLSLPETSAALHVAVDDARDLVGRVLRKLALRSPGQLAEAWPRIGALAAGLS